MGLSGSLIASTCRSNQSLTAWLVAQTKGPANTTPRAISNQRPSGDAPEETAPQPNAHIGANQVIGFKSSKAARHWIACIQRTIRWTHKSVNQIGHSNPGCFRIRQVRSGAVWCKDSDGSGQAFPRPMRDCPWSSPALLQYRGARSHRLTHALNP